jgi:flagellar secretion chaperone FliS
MNPYARSNQAYKKASVTTKDQGTLILMLYDGTIRYLKIAVRKMQQKDLEATHNAISRAKAIISELMTSLNTDQSGRVGASLKSLYVYMYNRLIDANIQKNPDYVEEVCELMDELREGWRAVVNQKKMNAKEHQFNNRNELKPLDIKG